MAPMIRAAFAVATAALVVGCASTTTANAPAEFAPVNTGTYDVSKQPFFVDCVFDAFLGSQNSAFSTHVRQTKRATGWRIDIIGESRQFMVADITDDGKYRLTRSFNAVPLDKEIASSRTCLEKFGTVERSAPDPRAPTNNVRF